MPSTPSHRVIFYIMLAVFVWGALLALGAYFYGGNRQLLKADIILGCVAIFLGLWAILLRARARRMEREAIGSQDRSHEEES
jgi:membrane protein DedA with SNARE-associated domain